MLKLERILCPLDFSEFSAKAYDYAQSLARRYHATLLVEHVVQPVFSAHPSYVYPDMVNDIYQDMRTHAAQQLEQFVKSHTPDGEQVECHVRDGAVTEAILALAESAQVDLIVMGTHGRHGFDRLMLGSVTEKVLRKARCPVLVVRRPAHDFVAPADRAEPVRLHRLLFCTDFSPHSERALAYALSLAEEYQAELALLHVIEEIPASSDLTTTTAEVVRQLEASFPAAGRGRATIKPRMRVGRPYQEIVRFAQEAETDLVVLGVRGRGALDLALFGSTTHRVIQQAPCPVLAVHI